MTGSRKGIGGQQTPSSAVMQFPFGGAGINLAGHDNPGAQQGHITKQKSRLPEKQPRDQWRRRETNPGHGLGDSSVILLIRQESYWIRVLLDPSGSITNRDSERARATCTQHGSSRRARRARCVGTLRRSRNATRVTGPKCVLGRLASSIRERDPGARHASFIAGKLEVSCPPTSPPGAGQASGSVDPICFSPVCPVPPAR